MDLGLNHLTEEERDRIRSVLQRDEDLRHKEHDRVRKLRGEVKRIRLKGVIKVGHDSAKTCARCRETFGWFFNKGQQCPQCQHKVCDQCRTVLIEDRTKWLCVLCYKQMELDAMSGQWFLQKFRKSKRNRKTNKVISGNEMVKACIYPKHHPSGSGREAGRGNIPDDLRKPRSNNNSPKSVRSLGSASAESSDTQSTASTSPSRLRSEVQQMGFPKESDKQKLLDLIRSKAPIMKSPEPHHEDLQPPTVEVRRVSLSRYRSDSESSSSSDPSSPQLSARTTESAFTHSDSIRSSIRSSSAFSNVSAVSSDGRITVVTESCVSDIDTTSLTSLPESPMVGRRSVTPENMYDKQDTLFQSSDSVIENPAHKRYPTGIKPVSTLDDTDGTVLIPQNKVTVQRVITRKQHDSLSSDSEAEETTTEQIGKVTFRRVSTGKGRSRSRSPSPDGRPVRSKMADAASDGPSSSEIRSVRAQVWEMESASCAAADSESVGEGQAGGGSNTAPLHATTAPLSSCGSSLSLPAAEAATTSFAPLVVRRSPADGSSHMDAHGGSGISGTRDVVANKLLLSSTSNKVSTDDDGDETVKERSVREKVNALLLKYGRDGEGFRTTSYNNDGGRDVNGWEAVPRGDAARGGPGAEEEDDDEDDDRASTSSYEIIESGKSSSFEDLEWDAEMLFPNLPPDGSAATQGEWEELQAAVEANMAILDPASSPATNYRAAMTRARFLEDEVDGEVFEQSPYVNVDDGVGHVRFQGMRAYSEDDSSENLSVITEVTEPDEDFLPSEYDSPERALLTETVMAHGFPVSAEEFHQLRYQIETNKSESNQSDLRHAMFRTESMRSSVESDLSRKSITPSSDIEFNSETDLSMSQVSEASATESALDTISLELRHNMAILETEDYLDQMLTNLHDKNEVIDFDFDQMYLHNLSFVDESEHEPLFCPVDQTFHQPVIKETLLPRKLDIVDGTVRNDTARPDRKKKHHKHDPTALSAAFKGDVSEKKKIAEPVAHPPETLREVPPKAMRVSVSNTELLAVKLSDDPAVSPTLCQRRAELRSVAKNPSSRNRRSDPLDYGQVKLTKDAPIDNSHVGSISDLTKMFDKPLPWMNARVTELDSSSEDNSLEMDPDTEAWSERSAETVALVNTLDSESVENDISLLSVEALQRSSSDVPSVQQHEFPEKKSKEYGEVEKVSLREPEVEEQLISQNNTNSEQKTISKDISKKSSLKISRKEKKEKERQEKERLEREKKERQEQEKQEKERLERERKVRQEQEKQQKERLEREKKERQEQEKQEKKERKEREKREKQEKKDRKKGKETLAVPISPEKSKNAELSQTQGNKDKIEVGDLTEQNVVITSTIAASLDEVSPLQQVSVREQPFKLSKRSPSPTAQAVREKVETSKSVPVREIICEELEREILEDVARTAVSPEKDFSVASATYPVYSATITSSPTTTRAQRHSSPTTNPSAEEVERAVEQQLEDWKKKRKQRRSNVAAEFSASPPTDDTVTTPGHAANTARNLHVDESARHQHQHVTTDSKDEDVVTGMDSKRAELRSVNQGDRLSRQTVEELYVQSALSVSSVTTDLPDTWQDDEETREEELEVSSQSDEVEGGLLVASARASSASPFGQPQELLFTEDLYDHWQTEEDDLQYADTEGTTTDGTLTPDPDRHLDDTEIIEKTMSSTTDSRRFIDVEGDLYYEEAESLSYTTGTTSSIDRLSCDAGSGTMGPLSVDTQDSASVQSSLRSSQYSPTSGSHVSGGMETEDGEHHNNNLNAQSRSACVSYDSLDVLVDEESDTAEERAHPEKVEEDFTLSLDLGPRPLNDDGPMGGRLLNIGGGTNRVLSNNSGGGGSDSGGGDGPRTQSSLNEHAAMLHTKSPPAQSLPEPAKQHPDHCPTTGLVPSSGTGESSQPDTSSLTESDAESSRLSSGVPDSSSSLHDHRSSNPSVPSISVSHDRESKVSGDRHVTRGATGFSGPRRDEAVRDAEDEEEMDDIDELFAAHASPTHSTQNRSNLLSPFSGSRESIVSYYSDAGEGNYGNIPITGEILFALEYNYKTGALEVKIKQCRDIAPVDAKKKRSDPYVKTYLLPDKTKSGKRKTRVKKHSLTPVFDEVLKYSVTKSELETRTLWLTVWHSDMFGRNDFLGEVTVPLDYYTFDDPSPRWYKLQERNASPISLLTYKGDLILSLRYITSENTSGSKTRAGGKKRSNIGELHILLKEARNLTAVRANGSSDTFCKGYLLPDKARAAKQKTQVIKKECNPQWNHTFVFEDVMLDELRERSLELTVWDHDRFTSNDFLGGIRLNLGTGRHQGKDVEWMDAKGEEISVWQSMLDRPNCWIDANLMLRTNMTHRK